MFEPKDIIPGTMVIASDGEMLIIIQEFEDKTFTLLNPVSWAFCKGGENAEFMADYFNDAGYEFYEAK